MGPRGAVRALMDHLSGGYTLNYFLEHYPQSAMNRWCSWVWPRRNWRMLTFSPISLPVGAEPIDGPSSPPLHERQPVFVHAYRESTHLAVQIPCIMLKKASNQSVAMATTIAEVAAPLRASVLPECPWTDSAASHRPVDTRYISALLICVSRITRSPQFVINTYSQQVTAK